MKEQKWSKEERRRHTLGADTGAARERVGWDAIASDERPEGKVVGRGEAVRKMLWFCTPTHLQSTAGFPGDTEACYSVRV